MMQIAAYGRLGTDPKSIATTKGTAMAVSSIACTIFDKEKAEHTYWLSLVAFGKQAEALLRHQKGDLISVGGRAQMNVYSPPTGERREQLQIIADSIISAGSARPSTSKRTNGNGDHAPPQGELPVSSAPPTADPRDFNDDIPF